MKAEQTVSQEVARRLAAAGQERSQWPPAAREAVEQAEQQVMELKEAGQVLQREVAAALRARDAELQLKVRRPEVPCFRRVSAVSVGRVSVGRVSGIGFLL